MKWKEWETNLQEKLEARKLTPSETAWHKLAGQLEERKKTKVKKYWWLGAAAVFVLGFLWGVNYWSSSPQKKPSLVTTVPPVKITPEKKLAMPDTSTLSKKTNSEMVLLPNSKTLEEKAEKRENVKLIRKKSKKEEKRPQWAVKSKRVSPKAVGKMKEEQFVDPQKQIQKAIAKTSQPVTDQEVDALLKQAQKRLKNNPAVAKNTVTAKSLLQSVTQEANETIQDKLFKIIKKGLKGAKDLLVTR